MVPARSHSARAEGFGRTARVMAVLRRRRVLSIRVYVCVEAIGDFIPVVRLFASPRAAARLGEATHTSRAALRLGTAAVVKRSAGPDCVVVSPLGSVVMPGSASFNPPKTA